MDRPEFSEVLYRRRRELGLTIDQAARALRLIDRVLVAFEEGDWESMPKSGYAQGMLASYARYLGLDTREVQRLFTRDLEEYQQGRGEDDTRLRGPDSTNVVSGRRGYSGPRGLLPTSGGYAGDMEDFSSVSAVSSRGSYGTYGTASPSYGVGSSHVPAGNGYSAGSTPLAGSRRSQDGSEERRYTTRQPSAGSSRTRTRRAGGSVRVDGYGSEQAESQSRVRQSRQRGGYRPRVPVEDEAPAERTRVRRRDQVTTRRVSDGDYVDDLRYDDRAETYRAASTYSGRVGYRPVATPERPNVRRQDRDRGRSGRSSSSRSHRRSGGLIGQLADLIGGNGQLVFVILVVAAIILTVIIISSVSSCVANATSTGRESKPAVERVDEGSSADAADAADDADSSSDADDAAADGAQDSTDTAATSQTSEPETKVEVTVAVADAGITWVEITVDGQTQVAETKTGPWSATYNVTRTMKIDVSEPAVVTVTRNGVVQTFDAKASGVGTITIDGPADPISTDDSEDETSDGTSSEKYTVLQYNDDGSWYDQNWYYHDGMGGYYTDDGAYHEE